MKTIPPEKVVAKLGQRCQIAEEWQEIYESRMRVYAFRAELRGGILDPEEAEILLQMRFHKDYLLSQWFMDILDEEKERATFKKFEERFPL